MARFLNSHWEENGSSDGENSVRQRLVSFTFHVERTQICRGYAYTSFACFFFTFFLFFIKLCKFNLINVHIVRVTSLEQLSIAEFSGE